MKKNKKSQQINELKTNAQNCMNSNQFAQAIPLYEQVLRLMPNDFIAINNCGFALYNLNQLPKAKRLFEQALRLDARHPIIHQNLGLIYKRQGQYDQAIQHFKSCIKYDPKYADGYALLGNTFHDKNDLEQTIDAYHKALELNPAHSEAHANLSSIYEGMHQTERSCHHANQALKVNPNEYLAHLVLARLSRYQGNLNDAKQRLEALLPTLQNHQLYMSFTMELSKVYDKLKEYPRAFAVVDKAKRLQLSKPNIKQQFEKHTVPVMIQKIKYWLPQVDLTQWQNHFPQDDKSPVFFVGFPRSGTTLMQQILDSHPDIRCSDEEAILNTVVQHIVKQAGGNYLNTVNTLDEKKLLELRQLYWHSAHELIPQLEKDTLFIDKLPLNVIHLYLIQRIFPDAKILFALRDPRDACISCFLQDFESTPAMIEFMTLTSTVNLYTETLSLWELYKTKLTLDTMVYRYEDLITNPQQAIEPIIQFLGLDWTDELLNYHQNAQQKNISTPSYHAVTQPIYQSARQRWLNYQDELSPYLPQLEKFIAQYGYR